MDDERVCRGGGTVLGATCYEKHGKIYPINGPINPAPPLHYNCRCYIEEINAAAAGTATSWGDSSLV